MKSLRVEPVDLLWELGWQDATRRHLQRAGRGGGRKVKRILPAEVLRYMGNIGRIGGAKTSERKTEAARKNARMPRKRKPNNSITVGR